MSTLTRFRLTGDAISGKFSAGQEVSLRGKAKSNTCRRAGDPANPLIYTLDHEAGTLCVDAADREAALAFDGCRFTPDDITLEPDDVYAAYLEAIATGKPLLSAPPGADPGEWAKRILAIVTCPSCAQAEILSPPAAAVPEASDSNTGEL